MNKKLHAEAFNDDSNKNKKEPLVVGSLDFKAMYPSFKNKECGAIVKKMIENGPANIEVNEEELVRFLKVVLTDEEIDDEEIEDLLHTVKDGETKPKITDPEMTGSE